MNSLKDKLGHESELLKRVATAAVLLVVIAVLVVFALQTNIARLIFSGLGVMFCAVAAFEFATVCGSKDDFLKRLMYFLICFLPPGLTFLMVLISPGDSIVMKSGLISATMLLGIFISFLLFISYLFIVGRHSATLPSQISQDAFWGIFLVGFCGGLLISLPLSVSGVWAFLWLMLVVMASDSSAYFLGKAFGTTQFAAYLSPKKTVAGSLAGILASLAIGTAGAGLLPPSFSWNEAFFLALAVSLAGQAGDLAKSYVKRIHGVDDMGTLLPGHGGVLDRIDGLLCAAPFVYFAILFYN